jgi:hypothetical protein
MRKPKAVAPSGPLDPSSIPTKGLGAVIGRGIIEAGKRREAEAAAAAAVAAERASRKKQMEDQSRSYADRVRAAALSPTGMKKGGAVKKKTVAKPMVKAKARKK